MAYAAAVAGAVAVAVGGVHGRAEAAELHSSRNGVGAGQARIPAAKPAARQDVTAATRIWRLSVRAGKAKIRKGKKSEETEYPWPDKLSSSEEGSLTFLSRFKPLPYPPKPVTLPFERPLVDLVNKIDEVRELANKWEWILVSRLRSWSRSVTRFVGICTRSLHSSSV